MDSSELAFKIACINAFKQGMLKANPQVLEPVMGVEITVPKEFQSTVVSSIGKRKGVILNSENMVRARVVLRECVRRVSCRVFVCVVCADRCVYVCRLERTTREWTRRCR